MDDFENERNEQLIKEREDYEEKFFEYLIKDMVESDELDNLIADRLNYIDEHFDFEPTPEYKQLEDLYIGEFDETHYDDYFESEMDIYDFEEEIYAKFYEEIIEETEIENYKEEVNLKKLIEQHVQDEKEFLDSILIDVIQEQSYFEKAIDELIFEQIEEDYSPEYFDYEPDYWYDDPFENWTDEAWPEDESIKDPFDSLGDIDYPDFEPRTNYNDFPEVYDDEEEKWLELEILKRQKAEEMFEPPEEVIPEPPEEEKIIEFIDEDELRNQELIKNYVDNIKESADNYLSKDDALDKIIKEKLKEKKFNN